MIDVCKRKKKKQTTDEINTAIAVTTDKFYVHAHQNGFCSLFLGIVFFLFSFFRLRSALCIWQLQLRSMSAYLTASFGDYSSPHCGFEWMGTKIELLTICKMSTCSSTLFSIHFFFFFHWNVSIYLHFTTVTLLHANDALLICLLIGSGSNLYETTTNGIYISLFSCYYWTSDAVFSFVLQLRICPVCVFLFLLFFFVLFLFNVCLLVVLLCFFRRSCRIFIRLLINTYTL